MQPATHSTSDRRKGLRLRLKVIHCHRIDGIEALRVSELMFVQGRPIALPEWISLGGIRTPLFVCELDSKKLARHQSSTYWYDGTTVDPRFGDARV